MSLTTKYILLGSRETRAGPAAFHSSTAEHACHSVSLSFFLSQISVSFSVSSLIEIGSW